MTRALTVIVCTPNPLLKDVSLKLEVGLGVLARIIELITSLYWLTPSVSVSATASMMVKVEPETAQVLSVRTVL